MTFEDFYKRLNLTEYPFSTFTTENEQGKEKKLFSSPNNYSTLIQAFQQNSSVLLIGERGIGKTAILLDFERALHSENDIAVKIDDYSSLDLNYDSIGLYKFLLQRITNEVFQRLAIHKNKIRKLSQDEKILMSYLLKEYVPTYSKRNLKIRIEQIQISQWKNILRKIGNWLRPIFNYTATAGSLIIDDYIAKHFKGLPPISDNIIIKEYFPEIPASIHEEFESTQVCYQFFESCMSTFRKLNFSRISIFLDKVDEDHRLENNGELIGDFIKNILTDNKLLLNQDIQLVIALWQTPFNYIKENVRTQKHFCPVINWGQLDIENAINRRLQVFSNDKIHNYQSIFCENLTKRDLDQIIHLSNKNPRDLWHIMDIIFKEQYRIDSMSNCIQISSLKPAFEKFVKEFNYYEYYPKKINARANSMDFYSYVSYLLKLDDIIFTKNMLNEQAGTGGSTNNYVIGMERIGLIEKDNQQGGVVYYRIKDPKVIYALENGIKIEIS